MGRLPPPVNRTHTGRLAAFPNDAPTGTLGRVFADQIRAAGVTAAEARDHVAELEAERTLARSAGVADIHLYMHDLEAELQLWREQYATAAVTEIATLRAELFGANFG